MAQEKPFEKLRPNTQKAIRNETKRKMEGRYPRTWIDAALGIEDPPWWWQGVTWLPGRAVPAFLTGIGEGIEGIDIMLSPVDTALKQNLELAIENAEKYRRTRGEDSWQYQHAKQRVDYLLAEWHAGGSGEWRKGKLGIEALHQQILDEADPPHLRALRKQAERAFDDGRGYMSKEHRDAVKAYNEAKAKPYPKFEKVRLKLNLQDLVDDSGAFMTYSEAKKRWGDKLVKKEYDYWYNYVETAESSFNLTPIKPVEIDGEIVRMRYLGVNGSDSFDVIYDYLVRREWDNVIEKKEDRLVLQVIQGDKIGETWSGDGKVIKPKETLAVFDLGAIKRFPYTQEK